MAEQEIFEGNKLIAEFMGRCGKHNSSLYWVNIKDIEWITIDQMKFNSSWDWIIPVIIKIKNTDVVFIDNSVVVFIDKIGKITRALIKMNIEDVRNLVVEFIKWYNEHQLKT